MRLIFLILALLTYCASPSLAQSRRQQIRHRVDSVLQARYDKVRYDTNYITRPRSRLTLKVRANVSGYNVRSHGTFNGVETHSYLQTSLRSTLSFSASYRGLTAGLSINPGSLSGRNKDFEFNLNAYSRRFSIDASYQDSRTLTGTIENRTTYDIGKDNVRLQVLTVAAYYAFNYRRFSYPAAFTQSYIQRRSAGSWLAGLSFKGTIINTTDNLPAGMPSARIYVGHLGLGGGYAYNLVVRDKWLFHLSVLPTLVVFNRSNVTIADQKRNIQTRFPDMIFNERVAIIHNFSPRYFVGATVVLSQTLFNDDDLIINENRWFSRAFFGVRL